MGREGGRKSYSTQASLTAFKGMFQILAQDINRTSCTFLLPDTTWPPTSSKAKPLSLTLNPFRTDEDLIAQAAKFG